METKLDAIKWALAHIDETFYVDRRKYKIVGAGFNGAEWAAICQGTSGWSSIDFDDCILSDLPWDGFYGFAYIPIDLIESKWEQRKKV